jgi:hypothetical protein
MHEDAQRIHPEGAHAHVACVVVEIASLKAHGLRVRERRFQRFAHGAAEGRARLRGALDAGYPYPFFQGLDQFRFVLLDHLVHGFHGEPSICRR